MSLGEMQMGTKEMDAARASIEKAIAISERLVKLHPGIGEYKNTLAGSYFSLGYLQKTTRQPAEAVASYERAIELCKELIESNPGMPSYEGNLAYAYNRLGIVHKETGDHKAAVAAYESAIPVLERLVAAHPEFSKNAMMLGGGYCNLANALVNDNNRERAIELYTRAIQTLSDVLESNPRDGNARSFLRNSHQGRSESLTLSGRYPEALADIDRCIELSAEPDRGGHRQFRAWLLARATDHRQAVREIDELLNSGPAPAQRLYAAACVYSLAAIDAARDEQLGEPDRKQLADRHVARAMELLAAAQRAGHFKSPDAATALKTSSDLEPLRSRDDFRELLATVELYDAPQPYTTRSA
jgi:tetratricopeptide (TPR) repeat protein